MDNIEQTVDITREQHYIICLAYTRDNKIISNICTLLGCLHPFQQIIVYRTYSYHWSYIHLVLTHARPEGLSYDRVFKLESVGAKENFYVCFKS